MDKCEELRHEIQDIKMEKKAILGDILEKIEGKNLLQEAKIKVSPPEDDDQIKENPPKMPSPAEPQPSSLAAVENNAETLEEAAHQ